MNDINGNKIELGCKIKAIKDSMNNHVLLCNDEYSIDLSNPVTVRLDDRGVLMAGSISLDSYKNRLIEIVK